MAVSEDSAPALNFLLMNRRQFVASASAAALPVGAVAAVSAATSSKPAPTRLELAQYAAWAYAEFSAVCDLLGIAGKDLSELGSFGGFLAHQAMHRDGYSTAHVLPILQAAGAPIARGDLHLPDRWREHPDVAQAVETHGHTKVIHRLAQEPKRPLA